jgi:hypothetical protein
VIGDCAGDGRVARRQRWRVQHCAELLEGGLSYWSLLCLIAADTCSRGVALFKLFVGHVCSFVCFELRCTFFDRLGREAGGTPKTWLRRAGDSVQQITCEIPRSQDVACGAKLLALRRDPLSKD